MTRREAYPLPAAVLDGDIAILGRKGGGKTVTGKGLVEQLLDAKARVLILDVLGVWAGLRTSADGKKPGYPVAIFGGEHGDLPLDPGGAVLLARVLATENLPAVIDLSDLSKAEQNRFVGAFLKELRRVNREALTLVLEEADVFAPQNPLGDDSKIVHAEIDWIARRGRSRGFRLITITQRPARLSKDVLTQASTLIVHKLPSPQDRDAVKAWVEGNGDRDQAREVFNTLAGLDVGEAWVYAPEHEILKRVRFPLMRTLDTSSTPRAGETRIEQKTLAQVDVGALREALTTAVPTKTSKDPAAAAVDHDARAKAEAVGYERGVEAGFAMARQQLLVVMNTGIDEFAVFMRKRLDTTRLERPNPTSRKLLSDLGALPKAQKPLPPISAPAGPAGGQVGKPHQKLLDGLAWWRAIGIDQPSLHQVGFVSGYAQGGTFDRYRSALRSEGLIDYPTPGRIALTEAGTQSARGPSSPPSLAAFHAAVRTQLSQPHVRLFDPLLEAWPGDLSLAQLGELSGYSAGGTFDRYRSALRSLDLIDYPRPGFARATDWLFPERLPS